MTRKNIYTEEDKIFTRSDSYTERHTNEGTCVLKGYTHGAPYTWSDIQVEPYTQGRVYIGCNGVYTGWIVYRVECTQGELGHT